MNERKVSLNPSTYQNRQEKYLDWREAVGSGIISGQEAEELEAKLRQFADATMLKREAESILGTSYAPALARDLTDTLINLGLMRLSYDGMKFSVQSGKQSRISPEALLAHGISPDIIKACTETTEYTYTVVKFR